MNHDRAARPLRRDAQHNRQVIMQAARTMFAERGLDVSLDQVARTAGLGVGTVYRRFPPGTPSPTRCSPIA
jgi:AcrR family transcriptional regulator